MSDESQGPGWWLASDRKWYPPDLHPSLTASVEQSSPIETIAPPRPDPSVLAEPAPTRPDDLAGDESTPDRAVTDRAPDDERVVARERREMPDPRPAAVDEPEPPTETYRPRHLAAFAEPEPPTNGYRPRHLAAPVDDLFAPDDGRADDSLVADPGLDRVDDLFAPNERSLSDDDDRVLDDEVERDAAPTDDRAGPGYRRWLALAGIGVLVAAGVIAAFALLGGSDDDTTSPPTTTAAAAGSTDDPTAEDPPTNPTDPPADTTGPTTTLDEAVTSVFALSPGTCIDAPELGNGSVSELPEISCDLAHSHEVYAVLEFESDDGVFDRDAVADFAADACRAALFDYARDELEPTLQYLSLEPTQQSWDRENDREVVCILFDANQSLTGSAAA